MKIIRFLDAAGQMHLGAVQPDERVLRIDGSLFGDRRVTTEHVEPNTLLAPLDPVQIICIGLNYRHHAAEAGATIGENPVVFFKSVSTLQHPGRPIEIPTHLASEEVDYECELAVIIGRDAKNVSPERALDYVLGYTAANDVSARDWQIKKGGGQWCRGKCFDTFCPLGPALVTSDEIGDPQHLELRTMLNGQVVQDWTTSDMIFSVARIVSFLSGSSTLKAGTVILTGTPHGVGMAQKPPRWLKPGDVVTIEIEKIGPLTNSVVLEETGVVAER